ncbi:MAG: 23S rRNA (pseudouridine(1915)-N(3))-methyltransferase RlmH [Prevotella sp.]|nr:23S rRNA (pseudouridine(1915)-N(3))-methyltransferase RlmH [Prevotella sp.]
MKTLLLMVDKTENGICKMGLEDYAERLTHYLPFEYREIRDEQILKIIQPSDTVVLLDERGEERRSMDFAVWLQKKMNTARRLVFVIGGPFGFTKAVYDRADEMVSLSRMTFSHQMVRMIFTEQLYRACTIIKGEKYHHE